MPFDQLTTFYEQVHVLRAACTVTFLPNFPVRLGVYLSPDTTSITDVSRLVENGLIKTITDNGLGTTPVALAKLPEVSLNCDIASYFGRRSHIEMLEDQDLQTTVAANPTEQVYFAVTGWQFNPDGSTAKAIVFDIIIDFDVIAWEPKKVAVS